jgi:3-hydroxy acid dehydrogenase / malonic semialdehyde reductase
MKGLKNKIVVITGATSGIGAACAKHFAKEKANLILLARRLPILKELSKELTEKYKIKVYCAELDVRKKSAVQKVFAALPVEWQKIDVLINNAGLSRGLDKIDSGKSKDWEEMIDTNLKGLLYVTYEALQFMVPRKSGHIINLGSTAGHDVYPAGNVYCATKFGVKALSESFRIDLLDKNIKVTSVDPGMVETNFSKVRFHGDESRANKVYKGLIPLSADDVADAIIYCATRPAHVNINEIILTPIAQASANFTYRKEN